MNVRAAPASWLLALVLLGGIAAAAEFEDDLSSVVVEKDLVTDTGAERLIGVVTERRSVTAKPDRGKQDTRAT